MTEEKEFGTYNVRATDAVQGISFTLYLNDFPMPIVGGKAPAAEFDITISKEYFGEGKFKLYGKAMDRSLQTIAYSVPVNLKPKDGQTVSFKRISQTPPPEKKKESKSSDSGKNAVETIKDATTNKLREKIQNKSGDSSGFWNNLK